MSSYYEKKLATGEVKCIDEEVPFEIPQGWEWCRLGELISYQNGYAYTSSELNKEGKGLPVIKSGNLMTYEVVLKPNNDYVENPSTKMLVSAIKKGDLLMCLSSQSDNPEPLGKTAIYRGDNTALLNQRVLKMRPWFEEMLEYMYYAINSEYFHYTVSHQGGGSAQANLKLGHVLSMLIPLAPLKEENRIVDKINAIMPLVRQYETTYLRQMKLNSEINDRLKASILQEAIQGKLVPQIAEEGTAQELLDQIKAEKQKRVKDGKLKKSALNGSVIFRGDDNKYWEKKENNVVCIDDEIPFEIPNSWNWCRLKDIGRTETGTTPSKSHPEYFGNYIPFLSPANILGSKIISETQGLSSIGIEFGRIVPKNSILQVCIGGSIGKCAIVNKPATFNQQINSITPYLCNVEFVHIVLQSEYFRLAIMDKATGTATPIINRGNWETLLFPLPPLKEQLRIIEKYKGVTSIMS